MFKPKEANEQYNLIQYYMEIRRKELSKMFDPYIKVTDRYGRLIARVTLLLGSIKPTSKQDSVIRDLMADVFDFLYDSRTLILSGKLTVAYPLARRAYESLSLLALCIIDPDWAKKWDKGKKINNSDIRRELAKHPLGESEVTTKELYDFFCTAGHPNRGLIPQRFLGEGNRFVLGAVAMPDLVLSTHYCQKHLNLWFWFAAAISLFYRKTLYKNDRSYSEAYDQTAKEAKTVFKWLGENLNRLLEEVHSEQCQNQDASNSDN